jgi:hypothetical protein
MACKISHPTKLYQNHPNIEGKYPGCTVPRPGRPCINVKFIPSSPPSSYQMSSLCLAQLVAINSINSLSLSKLCDMMQYQSGRSRGHHRPSLTSIPLPVFPSKIALSSHEVQAAGAVQTAVSHRRAVAHQGRQVLALGAEAVQVQVGIRA